MAPLCQNLFTAQAVHVTQFVNGSRYKLPFSVKIHVLFIFNETTRAELFIVVHGLALAMTND